MVGLLKNKRGWLEIVEAVVAVLLVAGTILILINRGYIGKSDISDNVYTIEVSIIREIQRDDFLRKEILATEYVPLEWDAGEFPSSVKTKITLRTPNYLECMAKICCLETDETCSDKTCNLDAFELENIGKKDIYSQSGIISPTIGEEEIYRKLNLFCWVK